jgi:hypothetical protein
LDMSKNVFITNLFSHREKGPMPPKKCVLSDYLILVGLGLMLVLLPGCGSGSNPAAKKQEKAAKSAVAPKSPTAVSLLNDKVVEEGSEVTAKTEKRSGSQRIEVVPGFTQAELESKYAPLQKKYEEYKKNMEVAPGITQSEVEARQALLRKKYEDYRANMEVAPGITQRDMDVRQSELRKKFEQADTEIAPGLTQEQLNAKMKQQVRPEGRDWFPPSAGK